MLDSCPSPRAPVPPAQPETAPGSYLLEAAPVGWAEMEARAPFHLSKGSPRSGVVGKAKRGQVLQLNNTGFINYYFEF